MDPEWASRFSATLFWDTAPATVDPERHRRWLVTRVLEYGTLAAWRARRDVPHARDRRRCAPGAVAESRFAVLKSLVYFDDAEAEPMPPMLRPMDWTAIRNKVESAVRPCL